MRPAVVVPHYGDRDLTRACLAAVQLTAPDALVVLVDNGPDPEPFTMDPPFTYHPTPENVGFGRGCNLGFGLTGDADPVVFLNNDTVPRGDWLANMVDEFSAPQVGVVGCRLTYPDRGLQHAGVELVRSAGGWIEARNVRTERRPGDVTAVTGACMAVRRKAFEQVGGFDENYWNGYEDVDLCLKMREAGWRVRYTDRATVTHVESAGGPERWAKVRENEQRLNDKWG